MRLVILPCVCLLACSSTNTGGPIEPDAAPDSEAPLVEDTAPPVPDTRPADSSTVRPETGPEAILVDTRPPVEAAAEVPAGRDVIAPAEGSGLSFPSCTYQTQAVAIMKAGAMCGRYPKLGPNGTILCFSGCTVELLWSGTKPAGGARADATAAGYCAANVDDYALSGSTNPRLGLCFADAGACATVCPSG